MNQLPTAVFLDRDGTIIEDVHYLSRPEQLKILPGAAEAISRANALLIPVVIVTNQSGIAREMFSLEDHEKISAKLKEMLATAGAEIDGSYFCPHAPEDGCDCRKPGTLLFRQAARDLPGIQLSRALYIGDRLRDVEPGLALGGTGVLVPSPETPQSEIDAAAAQARVAPSLATAFDWYLCTN